MTDRDLAVLYKVDHRTILYHCKRGDWGAVRADRGYFVERPPLLGPVLTPEAIAVTLRCSVELVRRWLREDKIVKCIKLGPHRNSKWRIDLEEGFRFMLLRTRGFSKGNAS
jgi:hypothetical protein